MAPAQPNPFLLAADNSPDLLPLLRSNPALASAQDEHGYSLMHAAASYSHLDLLRALVTEFDVNVDLKDEDGETALFVVETLDCAKLLVEELHANFTIRSAEDGCNARERIEAEGDYPEVAVYLRIKELEAEGGLSASSGTDAIVAHPPLVPEGLSVNIGTMNPDEDVGEVIDPEFKRRIDELAARDDFQTPAGQEELRKLITEAITGEVGEGREVRQRTE
ncbi:putative ankyrin repeat-containing protein [Botrytis fragariae]|uniref:Putative ankyrin repeat-containing protein n=1 Tax=Botrytis fragariae TaxID=1964551 RepID=A0A8H6EF99_9HELO|nr:putative ankyrin repeat-containing protein [Botrytis fragariae]KAF5870061.1 putative ankyrin repeat-containing protein [Botrytis fragariae]